MSVHNRKYLESVRFPVSESQTTQILRQKLPHIDWSDYGILPIINAIMSYLYWLGPLADCCLPFLQLTFQGVHRDSEQEVAQQSKSL